MKRYALFFVLLSLAALPAKARAEEDMTSPEVKLNGYYRVRPLYLKDPNGEPEDVTRTISHRLRLEPHLNLNEHIAVHAQIDALQGIWGANPGNVLTQSTADRSPNLLVRRAFGEVTTAVGVFRVGRMGSHWGLGILSNDGDGFRNDFGDAFEGDTYDRILFITKPLGEDGPLTTAILYDQILETDNLMGVLTPQQIREGDVTEGGIILNWKQGHLSVGTYTLLRAQTKTETQAVIPDLLVRYITRRFHLSVEGVGIFGRTKGVTAFYTPGSQAEINGSTRTIADFTLARPELDINMMGAAGEAGFFVMPWLDVALEAGYASGDKSGTETFEDGELSTFSFDPDYNVGLIMWDYANTVRTQNEFLATINAFNQDIAGGTLRGLCLRSCVNTTGFATTEEALNDFLSRTGGIFVPSRGAVRNAIYGFPKARMKWDNGLSAIAAVLWARSDQDVINNAGKKVSNYGFELDGGMAYDYTENFRIGLQAGIFKPGEIFDEFNGDPAPVIWTVQPRFTVMF